ncbi:hypothetical protein P7K49_040988, partial [Saguinus oedipus]
VRSGPGAAALVDAGARKRRQRGGGQSRYNDTGGAPLLFPSLQEGGQWRASSRAWARDSSLSPCGRRGRWRRRRGKRDGGAEGASGSGSGSGSVVLPAGMINPSVLIRNIRRKFAVVIGLIQVGEVINRDIVETALNL